jgi:hypothetical protein
VSLAQARRNLAGLQRELAALLMEPGRLEAFAAGPGAHLRRAGLAGPPLRLLASVDPEGMAFFARRRRIDRVHYLAGELPRTVPLLRATGLLDACFAERPYALDDPVAEAEAVARWLWAQGEAAEPAASLARIEASAARLMRRPHGPAPPSRRPARAPGTRLLVLRRDPRMLLRDPGQAKAGRFTVALAREPGDVEAYPLAPVRERLLRMARGRLEARKLLDAVGAREADLAWLRRRGLVAPDRHA